MNEKKQINPIKSLNHIAAQKFKVQSQYPLARSTNYQSKYQNFPKSWLLQPFAFISVIQPFSEIFGISALTKKKRDNETNIFMVEQK